MNAFHCHQIVGLTLAMMGALATGAAAASYTITNIADSTGPLGSYFGPPVVNDSGLVGFAASLDSGGFGLFTGTGGTPATLYDTSGPIAGFLGSSLSINSAGQIAFGATLDSGAQGIFVGAGGALTTIYSTFTTEYLSDPSLNNNGSVAFTWGPASGTATEVRIGSGGPITTLYDTTGPFSQFLGIPSLNDAGLVAFVASIGGQGVFVGAGGPTTTIADTSGPWMGFSGPILGDDGIVTVTTFSSIIQGNGGPVTTLLDTTGSYTPPVAAPWAASSGQFVVSASLDSAPGVFGIYTGSDPVTDKLIAPGDMLFGSTISALQLFRHSINDSGQVAFGYLLSNGVIGVALATPPAPPPPPRAEVPGFRLLGFSFTSSPPAAPPRFLEISTADGSATTLNPIGAPPGLDSAPDRTLWGVTGPFVRRVDPVTGLPGPILGAVSSPPRDLSFSPSGELLVLGLDSSLWTMDRQSGASTFLSIITDAPIFNVEFAGDGILYGTSTVGLPLFIINPNTGELTSIGPPLGAFIDDLDFAPDGVMYAMGHLGTSSNLYTVDLGTGALTFIGTTAAAPELVISLASVIPEPGSAVALIVLTLGAVIRTRRRR